MNNSNITKNEFLDEMSEFLSVSDVLAARVISDVTVAILSKRLEYKMTQKKFSEFMGVTQGMVSKWESGSYNFTIKSIAQICEKLNLSMDISMDEYRETVADWTPSLRNNANNSHDYEYSSDSYIIEAA